MPHKRVQTRLYGGTLGLRFFGFKELKVRVRYRVRMDYGFFMPKPLKVWAKSGKDTV